MTELPDTPENRAFVEEMTKAQAEAEALHASRWESAVRRDWFKWRSGEPCGLCGELVGHYGGDLERDPCPAIPQDLPLEEVRPNCYLLRRHRMADKVRAACRE